MAAQQAVDVALGAERAVHGQQRFARAAHQRHGDDVDAQEGIAFGQAKALAFKAQAIRVERYTTESIP